MQYEYYEDSYSIRELSYQALGGSCAQRSKRMNSWKLDIPDLDRRDLPNTPPKYPARVVEENEQKILHLSDVHLQLDYKVRRHRFYSSLWRIKLEYRRI